jgi:hypothetical protein
MTLPTKEELKQLGLTKEEYLEKEKKFLHHLQVRVRELRYPLSRCITQWSFKRSIKSERNQLLRRMASYYYTNFTLPKGLPDVAAATSQQERTNLYYLTGAYLLSLQEVNVNFTPGKGTPDRHFIQVVESKEVALIGQEILFTYLNDLTKEQVSEKKDFKSLSERVEILEKEMKEVKGCLKKK